MVNRDPLGVEAGGAGEASAVKLNGNLDRRPMGGSEYRRYRWLRHPNRCWCMDEIDCLVEFGPPSCIHYAVIKEVCISRTGCLRISHPVSDAANMQSNDLAALAAPQLGGFKSRLCRPMATGQHRLQRSHARQIQHCY